MRLIQICVIAVCSVLLFHGISPDAYAAVNVLPDGVQFPDGVVQSKAAVIPDCANGEVLIANSGSWYCGSIMSAPSGIATCIQGICAMSTCTTGYGDCDHVPANGCETALTSIQNCGGCAAACPTTNVCVTYACVNLACSGTPALAGTSCPGGLCDGNGSCAPIPSPSFGTGQLSLIPNVIANGTSTAGLLKFALPSLASGSANSVTLTVTPAGGATTTVTKTGGAAPVPADLGTTISVNPPSTNVTDPDKIYTYSLTASNSAGSSLPVTVALNGYFGTAALLGNRVGATATLLPAAATGTVDKVLIVGGGSKFGNGVPTFETASNTAELYDTTTGIITAVPGTMIGNRAGHTATRVGNKVYIMGGLGTSTVQKIDVYLIDSNSWQQDGTTPLPTLQTVRSFHTATLLDANAGANSGKIVVAGGYSAAGALIATLELFDPAGAAGNGVSTLYSGSGTTGFSTGRAEQTATPMGKWLYFIGGTSLNGSLDVLDTTLGVAAGSQIGQISAPTNSTARFAHAAAAVNSTRILVAGGTTNNVTALGTMQYFTVNGTGGISSVSTSQNMTNARARAPMVAAGPADKFLIFGGTSLFGTTDVGGSLIEQIDASGATPSVVAGGSSSLKTGRVTAAVADFLPPAASNKVFLVVGGGSASTNAAEHVVGP